jgi:hypothetical protein
LGGIGLLVFRDLPFYNPVRQFIKGLVEMHFIAGLIVSRLLGKRLFGRSILPPRKLAIRAMQFSVVKPGA